jgi:Mce-associated membrane protein
MCMMKRRPSRIGLALAVTFVFAAGLTVTAWMGTHRAQTRERASGDALANGKLFVTGDFANEYAQTTASLKPAATKEQAIVRAEVSAAGVVTASAEQVEVLLYVNQYRRNVNISGEKVDQNRVVLTLVPADGEWKVAHALAI